MKWLVRGVISLVVLVLGFFGLMYGASELGGEVVTLHKSLEDGSVRNTRIWIVENDEGMWIEHGEPGAFHIDQLVENPTLTLERDGVTQTFAATLEPAAHAVYHELRNEKYGFGSTIVDGLTGGGDACTGVPVRLSSLN